MENDRFFPISGIPGGRVPSMAEDARGNLWIANQDDGLFQSFHGKVVQQFSWAKLGHKDPAMVLAADPVQGGLWLGFFAGGVAYFKSDAALTVLSQLPRWGWVRVFFVLPKPLRDAVYNQVARNRYRIFGKYDACFVPDAEMRARVME